MLLDHLGEDERGEGLGDGTDFEDGVRLGGAIAEDAAFAVLNDPDGDAGVGGGGECAFVENGAEVSVQDALDGVQGGRPERVVGWNGGRGLEDLHLACQGERKIGTLGEGAVEGVSSEAGGETGVDNGNVYDNGIDRGGDDASDAGGVLVKRVEGAGPFAGRSAVEVELEAQGRAARLESSQPDAVKGRRQRRFGRLGHEGDGTERKRQNKEIVYLSHLFEDIA